MREIEYKNCTYFIQGFLTLPELIEDREVVMMQEEGVCPILLLYSDFVISKTNKLLKCRYKLLDLVRNWASGQ
jgi:hypothetical protein